MFVSPHTARKAVNIGKWDNSDAVKMWRNEESHLRFQRKASKGVYESYRLRLGPASYSASIPETNAVEPKQHMVLYYRETAQGTPMDDVTSLLEDATAAEMKPDVIDSSVFHGPQTLWISAWRSKEAAEKFEKVLPRVSGDFPLHLRIERDYSKVNRADAPHEKPGMI